MHKKLIPLLLLLPLAGVALKAQESETVTLTTVADVTIMSEGAITNTSGASIIVGRTDGIQNDFLGLETDERRLLVQFDVSSIPADAVIEEATLELTIRYSPGGGALHANGQTIMLHRLLGAWDEIPGNDGVGPGALAEAGMVTWTHRVHPDVPWENEGTDYVPEASGEQVVSPLALQGDKLTFPDLAADVQGWVDGRSVNGGWIAFVHEPERMSTVHFFAKESEDDFTVPPKLIVTYSAGPPPEGLQLVQQAAELGAGWYFSDWFGTFNADFEPWVNHQTLGFIFVIEEGDNVYLYDLATTSWWYTNATSFPAIYFFPQGAWYWYEAGTSNPRRFINLTDGTVIES